MCESSNAFISEGISANARYELKPEVERCAIANMQSVHTILLFVWADA